VKSKMTYRRLRHRFHLPNGLAIFAAVLLLVSSVVGFDNDQAAYSSGREATPSTKMESTESGGINDAATQKTRGLKLGLLLFRRG